MQLDAGLLLLMCAMVFVAGLSTGTTGLGFAQLTAVGLSFVVDPRTAVILLAITVPAISAIQLVRHRSSMGEWRRRMLLLSIGCLAGVPVGAALLTVLSPNAVAIVLGAFTLVFVLSRLTKPSFTIEPEVERVASPVVGFVGGVFNGTIGVSGPVLGSYLLALGVRASTFAFTIQVLFFAMTVVRLAGLAAFGEVTPQLVAVGAVLLAPAVTGQAFGFWLQDRVAADGFERIVLLVMTVAGIGLLVRGLGVMG